MFKIDSNKIRDMVIKNGMSIRTFAAQCGLSEVTARRLLTGERATLKIVGKIAKFFNVDADDLILS